MNSNPYQAADKAGDVRSMNKSSPKNARGKNKSNNEKHPSSLHYGRDHVNERPMNRNPYHPPTK